MPQTQTDKQKWEGGGSAFDKDSFKRASQRADSRADSHFGSPNHKTALTLMANIYSDQTTLRNASEGRLAEI